MQFDVAVIGGGPGGYVAAIKAAQSGMSVCLIEQNKIGGTCLNVGCIPTKFLLTNSAKYAALSGCSNTGIIIGQIGLDFKKMMEEKDRVVQRLVNGVHFLIKKNRICLFDGKASFINGHTLKIEGSAINKDINADTIIIASGSQPLTPSSFGIDGEIVCGSDEALSWLEPPRSLLIIGGGIVGCEIATIYSNLGTQVTIVEMQEDLVPNLDKDLAQFIKSQLVKKGVRVITENKVKNIEKARDYAIVTLMDDKRLEADKVIVSIGRVACIDELNLDLVNVKIMDGKIYVDDTMKTSTPNIYAIGDACSSLYDLAHVAMREGMIAAECINGKDAHMNYNGIPNCVYTEPEVACVGMTQKEAEEKRLSVSVGRFNFAGNGKAISMGQAEGFIKVVADGKSRVILGAQMAGPHVTDIIAQMAIAVENHLTVQQVADAVFAHPTLSEVLWEALESVFGKAIHN